MFAGGMTPLESAFWRGSLAGGAFFIHWLFKRQPLPVGVRDWAGLGVFAILGVALLEGSFVLSVSHGGAALASILLYSAPIWVNLAGRFIFKETIPLRRWGALALTLSGVTGICLWGSTGVSYAGFYIAGKIFFKRLSPVVVYMISFPLASIVILPFVASSSPGSELDVFSKFSSYSSQTILACVFVGITCTYLPYLLYGFGLRLVDASRAAIITTIEPVVAVILANIFWGETFSTVGYVFAALVVMGVAIS
jgi:DME family drug/metabolite transporter